MASDIISVCVYGLENKEKIKDITLIGAPHFEENSFDFHLFDTDDNFNKNIYEIRPSIIITFGEAQKYTKIWNSSMEQRKRWLCFSGNESGPSMAQQIMNCYLANVVNGKRFDDKGLPLVSVFTPTYKTGSKIVRPFQSLLDQTYPNWEWVIYDDSPDDDKTFKEMCELAKKDSRISVYKSHQQSGVIGEVKRRACMLAKGSILVELDHDDELTANGLHYVVDAFQQFPDAGFAFTDCAEVHEKDGVAGGNAWYNEGWGMGYGSYRQEFYKGRAYLVTNFPSINSKTIRHIVAAPNHIRAWKKDAYIDIGCHSSEVHVCDDYELILRTFLKTKMIHIQKLGYIQFYNETGNTQRRRNKEIQRLVKYFRSAYENQIRERFKELGVDDFCVRDGITNFDIPNPENTQIANYIYR